MRWYDPISEKWFDPPSSPIIPIAIEPEEDVYQRADRLNRIDRIWEAVEDISRSS